jgi:hypothetical protein
MCIICFLPQQENDCRKEKSWFGGCLLMRFFLLLFALFLFLLPVQAQTSSKPLRKTLTVKVLNSPSADRATVQVENEPGATPLFAYLTAKTKFHRVPERASTPGFVVGERVVVRVDITGEAPNGRATVRELWDIPLYEEFQRLRKEICVGTVEQAFPVGSRSGYLTVRRTDGTRATFRVTEKTRFRKGDAAAVPSVYPVEAPVVVKPRGLPNGDTLAAIVAESQLAVEQAHRDTLSIWQGKVELVNLPRFFLFQRDDGVKRIVYLPPVFSIIPVEDEKKKVPTRVYVFGEVTNRTLKIRLKRGEKPAADGSRTAEKILLLASESPSVVPAAVEEPAEEKEDED